MVWVGSVSIWAATAGVRCRLIRHHTRRRHGHRAGAHRGGSWRRSSCAASTPARVIAASRSASSGAKSSSVRLGLTWSSSQPHSCRAGARSPAAWLVEVPLPGSGGLLQLQGTGGTSVLGADLHRGPPHLHIGQDAVGDGAVMLGCPFWRASVSATLALNPVGQCADQLGSGGQVAAPFRVFAQSRGDAGQPRQRALAGVAVPGVVQPPIQDGGPVLGEVEIADAGDGGRAGRPGRCGAASSRRWARRVGQAAHSQTGHYLLGWRRQRLDASGPARSSAADVQGVDVPAASPSWVAGSPCSRCRVVADRAASSRARICSSRSVAVDGWTVSGRIRVCGSPSPTTCR